MVTVDQFLKALALVESSDDPEAWGDGGRAMGRWQVHPDRLWGEMHAHLISPKLGETWDQLVARVLRARFDSATSMNQPVVIAMFWHLGHWQQPGVGDWDRSYADKFNRALLQAQEELP